MVKMEMVLNTEETKAYEEIKDMKLSPVRHRKVEDIVATVAIRAGKHPAGYGMSYASITEVENGYLATWECAKGCE